MKIYKIIKSILFIAIGTLILIFNNYLFNNIVALYDLLGATMMLFGFEAIVIVCARKEAIAKKGLFVNSIISIVLGLSIFLIPDINSDFSTLCVFWAVWDIIREANEITESALPNKNCFVTPTINIIESIAVVVFSVMLVLPNGEHHVHLHTIVLGIEFLLEIIFPILTELEKKIVQKYKTKQNQSTPVDNN